MTTKAEKQHMGRLAELGCALTWFKFRQWAEAEVHHTRTGTGAARKSSPFDAIPLTPNYHRLGNEAFHVMGRRAWERHHGVTEMELLEQTRERLGIKAAA